MPNDFTNILSQLHSAFLWLSTRVFCKVSGACSGCLQLEMCDRRICFRQDVANHAHDVVKAIEELETKIRILDGSCRNAGVVTVLSTRSRAPLARIVKRVHSVSMDVINAPFPIPFDG